MVCFVPNEISNMKKSIQEEIEALRAETAAANAATAAYNREKETLLSPYSDRSSQLVTRRGRMPHSIKKQ